MAKKYLKHFSYIIAKIVLLMLFFFVFPIIYVHGEEDPLQRPAGSFEELKTSVEELKITGGTVSLTRDIIVSADEVYTYNNGRYGKEIVVETNGHTIFVEGYLELWPYLTIQGNGSLQEIFHVKPGGQLRMASICIDAGENGTAVIQEEGSFLICSSEESMGLPSFSCTGNIVAADKITAAAYSGYNFESIPVVRIPEGSEFSTDLLPRTVKASVNRDYGDYEEDIAVVWDESTFPSDSLRTLVSGSFTDEYAQYEDYKPVCLVVWESSEYPYFLNVYLESTQWYDSVFMYGYAPCQGTVYIQASDDGENWNEITGIDGYEPVVVQSGDNVDWILSYDQSHVLSRYYRLMQVNEDGIRYYSDIIELSEDYIFTGSDIEGGRGGEVSPGEGENQLPAQNESAMETESESETETDNEAVTEPETSREPESVEETQNHSSSQKPDDSAETDQSWSVQQTENADPETEVVYNETESAQLKDEAPVSGAAQEILQGVAVDSSNKYIANKKPENERMNMWSLSQQADIKDSYEERESESSLMSGGSYDESQPDQTADLSESRDSTETIFPDDVSDLNSEGVSDTLVIQIIAGAAIMIIILSAGIAAAVWFNKKH